MQKQTEDVLVELLTEIRNWIRASAHTPVKALLESALPDRKARAAYQMLDGRATMDEVRKACRLSPNALLILANNCSAAGIMEINSEKRRVRLFDLRDFGLIDDDAEGKQRRE